MSTSTPDRIPARRRGRPPSGGREAVLVAAQQILAEQGASRLTTREVARRAGVSEGSVFYHFTDRIGLLTAVIEDGVQALGAMSSDGIVAADVESGVTDFIRAVEDFLERALVVIIAAQSDVQLRTRLAAHLHAKNMGPHRGVQVLAQFISAQQEAGLVRGDIDADAVSALVYGSCFQRVAQRLMISAAPDARMPDATRIATTVTQLLTRP